MSEKPTFSGFDISYNQKSAFSSAWASGTIRLDSAEEIASWLIEQVQDFGPLLITQVKDIK